MALAYVTVTGNLGSGAIGAQAIFTASNWLQDAADGLMLPPRPVTATLSATGTFSVSLLASDNTAPAPSGWSWEVEFAGITQVATYSYSFRVYAGPVAFTATLATPAVFTATAPGSGAQPWTAGMAVTLSGSSLPGGFTAGTTYYLVSVAGVTFSLAATAGGTPIASSSAGSGSVTVTQVDLSVVSPVQAASTTVAYAQLGADLSGTPAKVVGIQGTPVAASPGGTAAFLRADGTWAAPPGGGGGVTSVTAADASVTVGGTASAPTVATGRLDQIASLHPPTAAVPFGGQKGTGVANGTVASDIAAFGQIPTSAGTIGGLLGANNLSDVASATTARTNLGLGSAATQPSSAFDAAGAAATAQANAEAYSSPTTALGDTTYGGTGGTPTRLAGNTGTTRMFWRQQGTGSASAAPAWDTLQAGDIPALPTQVDWLNVRSGYGATGNGNIVTDAAMTASSATLTSVSANFTSADVGKLAVVQGAGAAGAALATTISGFTNSTTVTLAALAGTTVSSATAAYGTDDRAAIQGAIAAAASSGATVYVPAGTYLVSAALTVTALIRITGDSAARSTIVSTSSGIADFQNTYLKGGLEIDHVKMDATGGHVFTGANLNQAHFHDLQLIQRSPGFSIWNQSGGNSLIQVTFGNVISTVYTPSGASRSVPAWSVSSTIGSAVANNTWWRVIWQNFSAVANGAPDNTQYQLYLDATGSANTHQHNIVRDSYFEQCFGGCVKSLSGLGLTIEGCRVWDIYSSAAFGSQTVGGSLFYAGKDGASTAPSWGTSIRDCGRDLQGPNGTTTYDVYLEATCQQTVIQRYETRQPPATIVNAYINANGSAGLTVIGCQSPATANNNSTTTISNNSGSSVITDSAGNISFSGTLTGASSPNVALPSDHGYISWGFDPVTVSGNGAITTGGLYVFGMYLRAAVTISSLVVYIQTAGSGLVTAENFGGLYNSAGTLLSGSADQTTTFGSTGAKTIGLTTPQAVPAGWVWAAVLANGTTGPALGRAGASITAMMDIGQGATNYRFGLLAAAGTSLPASFTPSSLSVPGAAFWCAVK